MLKKNIKAYHYTGAVAITEVLPNVLPAVAMGILAAVQEGIVLTKPPQCKDGKNVVNSDNYAGPALIGEAYRELLTYDGSVDSVY